MRGGCWVIRILFVCMGNICRSPALEATMKSLIQQKGLEKQITVDSCALKSFFEGSKPDPQIVSAADKRGIRVEGRATLFQPAFFDQYDWIFVVDNQLLNMLKSMANSKKNASKVLLVTKFAQRYPNQEMRDPYCGGEQGFEQTLDIAMDACEGILKELFL